MKITVENIKKTAKKFNLNEDKFKFIKKKNFFIKRYYFIYQPYNFFFQVDKNYHDMDNFFPYFSGEKELSNIQTWCNSIEETLLKNNQIIRDLTGSKNLRDQFKHKYNV